VTSLVQLEENCAPFRILTVADVPADPDSGAAGTVFHTNRALRELGHSVDEIWSPDLGPRRISHGNLHSLIEQPRQYVKAIRRAFSFNDYDVVIAQQPQSWMAARDHRRRKRKSLFLTMSQGVETRIWEVLSHFRKVYGVPAARFPHRLLSGPMQKLLAKQWKLAVQYSDGIIVQHTQDQDYISKSYGISKAQVHVSSSGLAPDFLQKPLRPMTTERMHRMLFVGQNAFYKGVHCLGEIVTSLLREFPQLSMTWVCNVADHENARSLFAADIRGRVTMIGWGSQQQLIDVLDEHGLFVFPTLAEGFAKAPLEAMARGMFVVASDCCGMRDYVSNDSGFLCPVGHVDKFMSTIRSIYAGTLKVPASQKVATTARCFSWGESAAQLVRFVHNLAWRPERTTAAQVQ
jgi:glycosyltransferase involved in cell wall biosynthesis